MQDTHDAIEPHAISADARANAADTVILASLALLTFLMHCLTNGGYDYFRDEFYYLACSDHLAAGYVDHPPLSILLLALARALFGDSLRAIRLLPAVAAAVLVFLTGCCARELGGGGRAQRLAALAAMVAPVFLVVGNVFSMNAFEPVFWLAAALLLIRLLKSDDPRLWLPLGIVIGLGLENKHSMAFFGLGVAVALPLTRLRRYLFDRWLWIGALAAFGLFVPNLLWEIQNGFPTIEFMHNAQLFKNASVSPLEFFGQQILLLHPLTLPLWLAGLGWLFVAPSGRRYRALGWIYIAVFALLIAQHGKAYYLAPAYPMLLAAGATAAAGRRGRAGRRLCSVYATLLVAGGIALAPLALPILPVHTLARYARALGVQEGIKAEKSELGQLPQHFADMFGWNDMVAIVAQVYKDLSPDDRARCAIFTHNYGEAGAIDFLGKAYGLPHAISGHNTYWLWGPGKLTGAVVIVLGVSREQLAPFCESLTQVAVTHCDYCMPFENNRPIFVCRNHTGRLPEMWVLLKLYI
jgi:hypothetical protein